MNIQMKAAFTIAAACILGIAAVTGTYAGHYGYGKMCSTDLVHTAYKSNLKTLVTAIDAAGLTETLMNGCQLSEVHPRMRPLTSYLQALLKSY